MTATTTTAYDAENLDMQVSIAAETVNAALQAHIAATSEYAPALIALARNGGLHPDVQKIIANSEHGLTQLDREDPLSSAHASLLARRDLELYPARLIMEENTPAVAAMIVANADSAMVRRAVAASNVKSHHKLI